MPVQCGRDSNGPYCRWGLHGKKYYYKSGSKLSRELAQTKAKRQGIAIHASQTSQTSQKGR
jgi:hypothetical protein